MLGKEAVSLGSSLGGFSLDGSYEEISAADFLLLESRDAVEAVKALLRGAFDALGKDIAALCSLSQSSSSPWSTCLLVVSASLCILSCWFSAIQEEGFVNCVQSTTICGASSHQLFSDFAGRVPPFHLDDRLKNRDYGVPYPQYAATFTWIRAVLLGHVPTKDGTAIQWSRPQNMHGLLVIW